ncbi:alpha/beta hydrolase [Acidovorax sp.]|uniref:alpha/beta hydrolase n=1 Tax=Acidovorax sp. TaxID=1872122 RepID=UPI00391F5B34
MGLLRSGGLHRTAPAASAAPCRKASPVLAFFLGALVFVNGCSVTEPRPAAPQPLATELPAALGAWRVEQLPGEAGARVAVLARPERTAPARFRVIVVPGSGCAGMGPLAERYFAGLLHAQVLVLHKPGVDPFARTAPGDCARRFVQQDRLSTWLAHARVALQADALAQQNRGAAALPQVLVGISEGAELLPGLAPHVPRLAGLVLLSASGLDPRESGALQAQRLGATADWEALGAMADGTLPDSTIVQGRSLGYWRDLWRWPVAEPLLDGPWPIVQVWGSDDALVPAAAYERFAQLAHQRRAGHGPTAWCARRIDGADHGLERKASPGHAAIDGVQLVWAWLEQWARAPHAGVCAPLQRG